MLGNNNRNVVVSEGAERELGEKKLWCGIRFGVDKGVVGWGVKMG